jgi:hypothetical protein
VQYSAVVWRNGELDAHIRQSPSPATDGMGTAQYGLDFTGPNNSIIANLDFTAHDWTSLTLTTGGVSAGRLEGGVTPLPGGYLHNAATWWLLRDRGTGLVGAVAAPVPGPIIGNAGPNSGLPWSSRLGAAPSAENRLIHHVSSTYKGVLASPPAGFALGRQKGYGDCALGKLVAVILGKLERVP